MDAMFAHCDELGPAKVIHLSEPRHGLQAIVVVDNVSAGPAIGGVRMASDVSVGECTRLARAMTLKNAAAGLAHGGGKSVIVADPTLPAQSKERLMRAFARAIADIKDYIPGPDMGTDERCMAFVHDEIGRVVGLPVELGGIPLDEVGATGFGVAVAVCSEPLSICISTCMVRVSPCKALARSVNTPRVSCAIKARYWWPHRTRADVSSILWVWMLTR
ncbi:MAG: glutamate dehydrogenase (NAD(P)+) [Gammaproteobacteria bacterium]|jgi:glutamate dehydrogenase (NAD(P)+)